MEEEDGRTSSAGVLLALHSFCHHHSEDGELLVGICGEGRGRKANSRLRARQSLIRIIPWSYKTLFEDIFTYFSELEI